MDKSKVVNRSSQHPHNISSWLGEKTENVAVELGRLYDTLQEKYPTLLQDEDMIDIFYHLLFDFSKIRSFAEGVEWEFPKMEKDPTVFEVFKANGLASFTAQGKEEIALENHVKAVNRFLAEWKDLISGTKAESRTLLHDLFNRKEFQDKRADHIEERLYQVSDNQLSWDEFKEQSSNYIDWLSTKPFLQRHSDIGKITED